MIAGYLGNARSQAMALQVPAGILFVLDNDDRVKCVLVQRVEVSGAPNKIDGWVYLDIMPDTDVRAMPNGIRIRTLLDSVLPPSPDPTLPPLSAPFPSDRYMGFNTAPYSAGSLQCVPGGLILFDARGRITTMPYGLSLADAAGNSTALGLLLSGQQTGPNRIWPALGGSRPYLPSAVGLVMYDRETFASQANFIDGNDTGANADAMAKWIDANATPIFVNRYDATLMSAQ